MKIIKYLIQAFIIYTLFLIIKIIGLNVSRAIFSRIFILFGFFFKSDDIINKNLQIVYNDLELEDKKKIKQQMWSNYGKTFVEYLFLKKFRKNKDHMQIEGEENLKDIIDGNKQVIFISGHFANFELMSMELTKRKIKLATIYRPLNNFFLNPFMEYVRETYVCKNQIKKGISGVKEAIDYIKKNYNVALMVDQRVSEGKKLPFFEEPALTTTLPAQLALKFNLEIIPIYIRRMERDNFEMEIYKPVDFIKTDNVASDKINLSIKINKIIEEMISRDPGQWIWTHNRWK